MLVLAYNTNVEIIPSPPSSLRPRLRPSTPLRLSSRETILLGKDEGETYYRLVDGCIALAQYLDDGRRQVCDILGPGRIFGFSLQGKSQCIAEALTYSTIERFSTQPTAEELANELRSLLVRQQDHALLLGRKTATERVATAILDLAEQFGTRKKQSPRDQIVFPVFPTRADLADWLGLSLETVSRCLSSFKRQKLLRFNRPEQIMLTDMAGLRSVAGLGRISG